jgi:hypothetical protein
MSSCYFRSFNGMTWPTPSEAMSQLSWRLTWAPESISKEEMLVLAALISAYRELINLPTMTRNERIRELRKGPNLPTAATDTAPGAPKGETSHG